MGGKYWWNEKPIRRNHELSVKVHILPNVLQPFWETKVIDVWLSIKVNLRHPLLCRNGRLRILTLLEQVSIDYLSIVIYRLLVYCFDFQIQNSRSVGSEAVPLIDSGLQDTPATPSYHTKTNRLQLGNEYIQSIIERSRYSHMTSKPSRAWVAITTLITDCL